MVGLFFLTTHFSYSYDYSSGCIYDDFLLLLVLVFLGCSYSTSYYCCMDFLRSFLPLSTDLFVFLSALYSTTSSLSIGALSNGLGALNPRRLVPIVFSCLVAAAGSVLLTFFMYFTIGTYLFCSFFGFGAASSSYYSC